MLLITEVKEMFLIFFRREKLMEKILINWIGLMDFRNKHKIMLTL